LCRGLVGLHRQIEAKKDALEKIKATSTARENQAEIYSVEQSAFEEARKIKVCLLGPTPKTHERCFLMPKPSGGVFFLFLFF
jgi:hypothetical protein